MAVSKNTIAFLKKLKKNNNREWFQANKQQYLDAKEDVLDIACQLIEAIAKFDPGIRNADPQRSIFRIYRDTRFSKDKTPYKTHFGIYLNAKAKKCGCAGYYLHLDPKDPFLAGGLHMPDAKLLANIRKRIAKNGEELQKILSAKTFKKYFEEMQGEQLKTAPKGFAKDHPMIKYLRFKEFLAVHNIPEKLLLEKNMISYCAKVYKAMMPFNKFLNT